MKRLQVEIDEENETRTELYERRSQAKEARKKAVIETSLVSCELTLRHEGTMVFQTTLLYL